MAQSSSPARYDDVQRTGLQATCARLHLAIGWWMLLLFLSLGFGLEVLHGFKAELYVDVANSTRRLMWRLSHAHGTLLSVVQLVFAVAVQSLTDWNTSPRAIFSRALIAAGLLIPLGFFLGGIFTYDGDPGLGVLLVPLGAMLLFVAVLLTALAAQFHFRAAGTVADRSD